MSIEPISLRAATAATLASVLTAGCGGGGAGDSGTGASATSPPAEISIPGTGIFPESITSDADGAIYIGSIGQAQIYRVPPGGGVAEVFIAPGSGGIKQVFGVLADDAGGTLWACSNEVGRGPPGAGPPGQSSLHAFDLDSGAAKASYAFAPGGFCNDIAVAPNGDVYATDTNGMRVLKLSAGGNALEAWSPAEAFGPAGGVLDGIAVVSGRVIVNTLLTSKLFAVEIGADGRAGAVKELQLSAPLTLPDGMRAFGDNGLLSTDGTGRIQHVAIDGDAATVTTVKEGLEGVVAVTTANGTGYALEGQLEIFFTPSGTTPPEEKPYRAVAFPLP